MTRISTQTFPPRATASAKVAGRDDARGCRRTRRRPAGRPRRRPSHRATRAGARSEAAEEHASVLVGDGGLVGDSHESARHRLPSCPIDDATLGPACGARRADRQSERRAELEIDRLYVGRTLQERVLPDAIAKRERLSARETIVEAGVGLAEPGAGAVEHAERGSLRRRGEFQIEMERQAQVQRSTPAFATPLVPPVSVVAVVVRCMNRENVPAFPRFGLRRQRRSRCMAATRPRCPNQRCRARSSPRGSPARAAWERVGAKAVLRPVERRDRAVVATAEPSVLEGRQPAIARAQRLQSRTAAQESPRAAWRSSTRECCRTPRG